MDSRMRILFYGVFLLALTVNSVAGDFSLMHFGHVQETIDLESQHFASYGMHCVNTSASVTTEPYWVTAGEFTLEEMGGELDPDIFFMISPNNIGYARSFKNALLGFVHQMNNDGLACVRVESHLGDLSLDTTARLYKIDWIYGSKTIFMSSRDLYVTHIPFSSYGCSEIPLLSVPAEGTSNPVALVSLNHPYVFTGTPVMHYDTVWTRTVVPERLSVCWADSVNNEHDHTPVDVTLIALQHYSVGSSIPSYVAGKVDFEWPAEASGFCVLIPYLSYFEIVPRVFVSLENDGATGDHERDSAAGAFIWVEEAGSASFEVCGTTIGGSLGHAGITAGTLMKIHYVLIDNFLDPSEEVAHLHILVKQLCQIFVDDFELFLHCSFRSTWSGSDSLSSDTLLLLDFLRQIMGENAKDLMVEYTTPSFVNTEDGLSTAGYYLTWSSPDPDGDVDRIMQNFEENRQAGKGIVQHENKAWQEFMRTVNEVLGLDPNGPIIIQVPFADIVLEKFGVECGRHYNIAPCSVDTCGPFSGTAERTTNLQKYDPNSVVECHSSDPVYLICNKGPCQPQFTLTPLIQNGEKLIHENPVPDPDNTGSQTDASVISSSNTGLVAAAVVLGCLVLVTIAGFTYWWVTKKKKNSSQSKVFGRV